MIRALAILCKLNSLKLSDKQLFDACLAKLDLTHCTCPSCGSSHCHSFHSCYERTMISIVDNHRANIQVSVPRIKCHCGHTHAVLPDILIPYGSYTIRFILIVLSRYLIRHCTVSELCDFYQISKSTLYEWIHLFLTHHNLLVGIMDSINHISLTAVSFVMDVPQLAFSFYNSFRFSFLQARSQTTKYGPPLPPPADSCPALHNSEIDT